MTPCALWRISHGHILRIATSLKSACLVPLGGYVEFLTKNKGVDPFNSGARIGLVGRTPCCLSGDDLWLLIHFPTIPAVASYFDPHPRAIVVKGDVWQRVKWPSGQYIAWLSRDHLIGTKFNA